MTPVPLTSPPDNSYWQAAKRPPGQGLPGATGTAAAKHSHRSHGRGRTKKHRKGGEEKADGGGAASAPLPAPGNDAEAPGASRRLQGGRCGVPGGPPSRSARRLLSARRAPGWLSLRGSLVLRSPLRAAHRGATVAMIPASERAAGGRVLPAGPGA